MRISVSEAARVVPEKILKKKAAYEVVIEFFNDRFVIHDNRM